MTPTSLISPYAWPGMPGEHVKPVPATAIIKAVCYNLQLAPSELKAKCRKRGVVQARYISFYLMKRLLPRMTQAEAAECFGMNRTMVIHGLEAIENDISTDPEVKALVERIYEQIRLGK